MRLFDFMLHIVRSRIVTTLEWALFDNGPITVAYSSPYFPYNREEQRNNMLNVLSKGPFSGNLFINQYITSTIRRR